jgi:hypothetical protein
LGVTLKGCIFVESSGICLLTFSLVSISGGELIFFHQITPTGAVWSQACSFTNGSYVVLSEHIRSHYEISGKMCPVKLDLATSLKVL